MRHAIAGNRLSRQSSHRKATVRDLAKSVLIQQRIYTTKAKAQEGRKMVEKLITLGKKGTLADKRKAFSILCDHALVSSLFNDIAPRFKNRVGGYTRIIRLDQRRGDNADMVFLDLTEKSAPVEKAKNIGEEKAKKASSKIAKKAESKKDADVIDAEVKEEKPKKSAKAKVEKVEKVAKPTKKETTGGLKKLFQRKTG